MVWGWNTGIDLQGVTTRRGAHCTKLKGASALLYHSSVYAGHLNGQEKRGNGLSSIGCHVGTPTEHSPHTCHHSGLHAWQGCAEPLWAGATVPQESARCQPCWTTGVVAASPSATSHHPTPPKSPQEKPLSRARKSKIRTDGTHQVLLGHKVDSPDDAQHAHDDPGENPVCDAEGRAGALARQTIVNLQWRQGVGEGLACNPSTSRTLALG